MHTETLQALAVATLITRSEPTNFTCFGRQHYRSVAGSTSRPTGAVRPYYSPGETHNDWSWRPSVGVKIQLNRGAQKCTALAFDEYLAKLPEAERRRVLTNKHNYENGYAAKLEPLLRMFADQMEGYEDRDNG